MGRLSFNDRANRDSTSAELRTAIAASWNRWTCDPVDQARWSLDNSAWGQCGATALVVQDHLGGELRLAEVRAADGSPAGWHYSNRLPDGSEFDLTRGQFRDGQVVGEARTVSRPPDLRRARIIGHCALLALRVDRGLAGGDPDPGRPVSVKAVCRDGQGRILLARNDRGEWELPGGCPEPGEAFEQTVVRELAEETGRGARVIGLIGADELEVVPGAFVDVVAYACALDDGPLTVSDEHSELTYLDPARYGDAELPAVHRRLAAAA